MIPGMNTYIYIIKDNRILKYEDRNILIYIYMFNGDIL